LRGWVAAAAALGRDGREKMREREGWLRENRARARLRSRSSSCPPGGAHLLGARSGASRISSLTATIRSV